MKKNNHGGARPGAGRLKNEIEHGSYTLWLPKVLIKKILLKSKEEKKVFLEEIKTYIEKLLK